MNRQRVWTAVIGGLLLATATVPHLFAASASAEAAASLADIAGHWAEQDIRAAVGKGYISGFEDSTFRPDESVSRAQYVVMLMKSMKLPVAEEPGGQVWYDPYLQTAKDLNLVSTAFEAGLADNASRRELLELACRALLGESAYSTSEELGRWAREKGFMSGNEQGELQLDSTATRAQTVVFLERLMRGGSGAAETGGSN